MMPQTQPHAHSSVKLTPTPTFACLKHVHPPEVQTLNSRECETCVCV